MSFDQTEIERVVLRAVLELNPSHLTSAELALKLAGDRDEDEEIREAIRDLRSSGVFRPNGDVVVPTYAALRTAELLL